MSFTQASLSIFIRHLPPDLDSARKLARSLRSHGLEVYLREDKSSTELSFSPIDWQLARSDGVIFLLSAATAEDSQLRVDAEKVMRRKNVLVIPALLDDRGAKNLPLVLRFIQPLELHRDFPGAVETVIEEIQRKSRDLPSKLRQPGRIWARPLRWLIEHFRRYLTLPPLTFCWQITVENLIVSLTVSGLVHLIWQPEPRTNLANLSAGTFLWTVVILSPVIETFLLQVIPVLLAQMLGLQVFGQLLFSMALFALPHFTRSVSAGIGAGVIGGFYSALTFVHWREKSLWTAYWVTSFSHSLYNFALFAMLIGEF